MQSLVNTILEAFPALAALSQAAATIALTALWQGAAVAVLVAISLKAAPRIPAAYRFGIWAAGFTAVLGLPVLSQILLLGRSAASAVVLNTASNIPSGSKPFLLLDFRWSVAIACLWLAASLYRAVDLAIHAIRLRRLWKSAVPVQAALEHEDALHIRGRRQVRICATTGLERPGVIGFFAPRILIPEWLLARLTPAELDQIVLHETEHLRRADDWTNLLQKISLILFPLSPALIWIERQLCLEREMACDEGVIRRTGAPRVYAACLAGLAEHGLEHARAEQRPAEPMGALSLGAWRGRPELARRIHRILLKKQALGTQVARGMLAAISLCLLAGSAELARCPHLFAFAAPQGEITSLRRAAGNQALTSLASAPTPTPEGFRSRDLPGAYLTNLKAEMPSQSSGKIFDLSSHKVILPGVHRAGTIAATNAPPTEIAEDASPATGSEESWIVLTTWGQVEPAATALVSDYASAVSEEESGPGQNSGQTTARMTVTQLVFHVVRATSTSPQTTVQIRSGWLVTQM